MHGLDLRFNDLKSKQQAMLLEAQRDRLIGLARGPRPTWTLSSLLHRKPKPKIVKT